DFQVEIENRESVRKLYQAVGSFDAVAIAAGQVAFAPLSELTAESGSFRWEANSWVRSIWFRRRSRSSKKKDPSLWFRAFSMTSRSSPASRLDRKSTRLNSSHQIISYAVFCLKKKKIIHRTV